MHKPLNYKNVKKMTCSPTLNILFILKFIQIKINQIKNLI